MKKNFRALAAAMLTVALVLPLARKTQTMGEVIVETKEKILKVTLSAYPPILQMAALCQVEAVSRKDNLVP